jgi:hypothetical protein
MMLDVAVKHYSRSVPGSQEWVLLLLLVVRSTHGTR